MIELDFHSKPRVIQPHPKVAAQKHRGALMYGPMLYCVEQADNPGIALERITVAGDVKPTARFEADLPEGVVTLEFPAKQWQDAKTSMPVTLKATPYYAYGPTAFAAT